MILICDVHVFHYIMYDNLTQSEATTLKFSRLIRILHKKYLEEILLRMNDKGIIIVNVVYLSYNNIRRYLPQELVTKRNFWTRLLL
jgi:hypothetical protein